MSLRCRSCNTAFHDKGSLEVHYQYAHSNGNSVPDGLRPTESDAEAAAPPPPPCNENQPPQYHLADRMYDLPHHNYEYVMNSSHHEYTRGSPAVIQNSTGYPFADQRYHMFQCGSQDMLKHPNFHVPHTTMPGLGLHHGFAPRFGNAPMANGATVDSQAEILDLDSHKVHLYHPPNGEDSQDSDHWPMDAAQYHHHQQQQQQQQQQQHQQHLQNMANGNASVITPNGRGGSTPLPSPDFGSVSTTQISSSDNPSGKSSSKAGKNSNGTWKSNEARRPKTYNCSACNKWFTSSGHLKRHYNTTLHKNAVKQSGAPDPATLPVSAHHHPQKDPSYPSSRQVKNSPPTDVDTSPPSIKLEYPSPRPASSNNNAFIHNSPNLMAGPTDVPGGLLHHPSYTQSPPELKSPSPITSLQQQQLQQQPPPHPQPPLLLHSNHTPSYLQGFAATPPPPPLQHQQPQHTLQFFQRSAPTTLHPNFHSPHVSTTHQVTLNSTGNLTEDDVLNSCIMSVDDIKLPSFACIQKNNNTVLWNAEQLYLSALDNGNVGGSFASSKDVTDNTNMLLCEIKSEPLLCEIKQEPMSLCEPKHDPLICDSKQDPLLYEVKGDLLMSSQLLKLRPQNLQPPVDDTKVTSSTERSSPHATDEPLKVIYSCEKCQKIFNKACYLTQHNKSFHSGYKPFKCARCGKRFPDSEQFKTHSDKHAGDKPYKCEICPKTFNHKTDLRRHACLHTNVRPYSCDICSKGFIRKDHMLKHRDTHQNRKSVQRKFRVEKVKKEVECI